MARLEREQNSIGRENSTEQIANRDADPRRPALDRARHAHQTRHPLRDLIEAGEIPQRSGRSEARDRAGDDARIAHRERFVVESERLHDAGAEVVDDDVGAVDEAYEDFAARRCLDRDADAFLRSICREKKITVGPLAVTAVAQLAARILDRLDLENLGSVVAKDLRAEWTGEVARQIDNFDSRQRRLLLWLAHSGKLLETLAISLRLKGRSRWQRMDDRTIIEHHP